MIETSVAFASPAGLHARPASELSEIARRYSGKIRMIHGEKSADVRSIIHMLSLGIKKGARVTIQVEGEGEGEMSERITHFITGLVD